MTSFALNNNSSYFWQFGPDGYYYFIGQQDGMQGVGPNLVQPGDEAHQGEYNQGWTHGTYSRMILSGSTI